MTLLPLPLMLPHDACQETRVSPVPVTVAANDWVPLTGSVTLEGSKLTLTIGAEPPSPRSNDVISRRRERSQLVIT